MKYLGVIISAIFGLYLATCGTVESIQDRDRIKAALVISWLTATWRYLTWKKQAHQTLNALMGSLSKICPVCNTKHDEDCDAERHE